MTSRRYVALGTSALATTRDRHVVGGALDWDGQLLLFDPGEGFVAQSLDAPISVARADAVLIGHFHGDHCLGLPGLLLRRRVDRPGTSIPVYFPAAGRRHLDALCEATALLDPSAVEPHPLDGTEDDLPLGALRLTARPLRHPVPTIGFRLQGPDEEHLDPEALALRGIRQADIGALDRDGWVAIGETVHRRRDLVRRRSGPVVAYVLDTAPCEAIEELADGADLLICEATFADDDRALAAAGGHLTARQAARHATAAGVARLVLTHVSARYGDARRLLDEARAEHPDVVLPDDLDGVAFPPRP